MAKGAEGLNFERMHQRAAPVVRFPRKRQLAPEDNLGRLKKVTCENYRVVQDYVFRSHSALVEKSNSLLTRFKRHAQNTRKEHALRIVALAAGTAFALGVFLRDWRSKQ